MITYRHNIYIYIYIYIYRTLSDTVCSLQYKICRAIKWLQFVQSEYTVKTCCVKGQNDWTTIQPITQVVVDNLTWLKVLRKNKMFCQELSAETTLEFEMASLDCTLHDLATLASKRMNFFEKWYNYTQLFWEMF